MKTVYWAPWGNPDSYSEFFLSYDEPVRLPEDLKIRHNKENTSDNYFRCPAFVDSIKNTFLVNSPTSVNITIGDGYLRNNLPPDYSYDQRLFAVKQASCKNAHTIRYYANWIFFTEESLLIHSTPPYMHKTPVNNSGYYVPGSFDISQWFRPLEYAYQMWDNVDTFSVRANDPLMYVNFLTDEKVELKKFYLTKELYDLSMSCVRLKTYRRDRVLSKLYNIFSNSGIKSRILKEIKNNLIK
jgi:hypothetical protein